LTGNQKFNDFKVEKKNEGSHISGFIQGTNYSVNVNVKKDKLIFDTSISGKNQDKVFVIKINGVSISFAQGGRDGKSTVKTKTVVPYKLEKNCNANINASYWLKARAEDEKTKTTRK